MEAGGAAAGRPASALARFFIAMRALVDTVTHEGAKGRSAAAVRRAILGAARDAVAETAAGAAFGVLLNAAYEATIKARPSWWAELAASADAFRAAIINVAAFASFLDVGDETAAHAAVSPSHRPHLSTRSGRARERRCRRP